MENVIEGMIDALAESMNEEAKEKKLRYVIAIYVNGRLYGYHSSSICQVTDDKLDAKRYSNPNVSKQVETILGNIHHTLTKGPKGEGIFAPSTYNTYWKGVKPEEVFLDVEYLTGNEEPHTFTFTEIK